MIKEQWTQLREQAVSAPGGWDHRGQIERVVLAHFDYKLLVHLCRTHQCELLVMNTEALSPEQELVQDLITITHCFNRRLYGLRNYRKALTKALTDDQGAQDTTASNT